MATCFFRFHLWTALTRNQYVKISAAQIGSALPQFAGYSVFSQLPLIPVYVVGLPVYIMVAFFMGRPFPGPRSAFWQRMGTFTDDVLATMRYFGDGEDDAAKFDTGVFDEQMPSQGMGKMQRQVTSFVLDAQTRKKEEQRRQSTANDKEWHKDQQIEQDVELGSTAEEFVLEEEVVDSEDVEDQVLPQAPKKSHLPVSASVNDSPKRTNLVGLVLSVVAMLCAAMIGIAVCAPLFVLFVALVVVWIAVYFAVLLAMVVYIPIISTVVLVSGSHLALFIFVAVQIATSLLGTNLGRGPYEWIIGTGFAVPLYMWICYAFAQKLIRETLSAMKYRLGDEHKLSKLSDLYFAVPINGPQAAIKVSDSATGKDGKSASRSPAFFVMSVHNGDLNHFLCRFVEKDQEQFYMGGMLTKRKNETDLTGVAWKGLENNSRTTESSV